MRVQVRDQLDRVKREVQYFDEQLSDEEGGSLDPPTIKKGGDDAARPGPSAVSPTRVSPCFMSVCVCVLGCLAIIRSLSEIHAIILDAFRWVTSCVCCVG